MSDLFIASRRIPHEDDGSRRTIAAGSLIGKHARVKLAAGYGFIKGAEMLIDTLLAGREERLEAAVTEARQQRGEARPWQ